MNTNENFLLEFDNEIQSTRKLLECVPTDKWGWKPHHKSMSLGELAKHVVELTLWTKNIAEDENFDLHKDYKALDINTTEDLLKVLDNYQQEIKELYSTKKNIQWDDTWELKAGEHSIMNLPKHLANRFIVNNHIYHHRGQLSVYLRLLDIPIPGMYGPSADQI
ncbi:DinB family protein [Myroides sp. LJL119]